LDFSLNIKALVPAVPYRSPDEIHATFYAGCHLLSNQVSCRFLLEFLGDPSFDIISLLNDATTVVQGYSSLSSLPAKLTLDFSTMLSTNTFDVSPLWWFEAES
jgi:hypothetical protein